MPVSEKIEKMIRLANIEGEVSKIVGIYNLRVMDEDTASPYVSEDGLSLEEETMSMKNFHALGNLGDEFFTLSQELNTPYCQEIAKSVKRKLDNYPAGFAFYTREEIEASLNELESSIGQPLEDVAVADSKEIESSQDKIGERQ